jgi:hypothetical protein
MKKIVWGVAAILAAQIWITGVQAQERLPANTEYVSAAQIREHGSVKIALESGRTLIIHRLQPRRDRSRNCRLRLRSLIRMVDAGRFRTGIVVTTYLGAYPQETPSGELEIICDGEGSDCEVDIEVDG